jgi:hypothetical protein
VSPESARFEARCSFVALTGVTERNRLIHDWLAAFDPNSIESCCKPY